MPFHPSRSDLIAGEAAPLESVLCTDRLRQQPPRLPDFGAENRSLRSLLDALADSPRTILQTVAERILETLHAGSAGFSLLRTSEEGRRFLWSAIAGAWKPFIGTATPSGFSPCS